MTELYDEKSFPEKPIPTTEDLTNFKNQVAEWMKLDDQVHKLAIAIRERRIHQKALSTKIQEFMIEYGYDNLNTTQGIVKSNVRNCKVPLKLATVKTEIEKLGDTTISASELLKKLFEAERPVVIKQSLTRRVPKVSMQLDI